MLNEEIGFCTGSDGVFTEFVLSVSGAVRFSFRDDPYSDNQGGVSLRVARVPEFRRGDVNGDGSVNIIDAMFGAQYLVGLRPIEQIRPLNLASVKHDGENGDVMNIIDCMFIAQYCVEIRNCYYEAIQ